MKKIDIIIDNPTGLHARPAKYFVNIAKQFKSDISVLREDKKANAKSLVSMLTLGVKKGYTIQIIIDGTDEEDAAEALNEAIENGLGEPRQTDSSETKNEKIMVSPSSKTNPDQKLPDHFIKGISAATGIGIGPVWHLKRSKIKIQETFKGASVEQTRLQEAIEKTRAQLIFLGKEMEKHAADEADIFNVHLELLEDPELLEKVLKKLENGETAAQAWQSTIDSHAQRMRELDDPLLAAREADLHDVSYRVLRLLVGVDEANFQILDNPVIIIANDLSPSETATLDKNEILGFCTATGGPTSHSAIIARAMGIPAIVGAGDQILDIQDQTIVILDGDQGLLNAKPSQVDLEIARKTADQNNQQRLSNLKDASKPAITLDGHRIEIVANIGGVEDALNVVESGAKGVGLFRTEFLFLDQEHAPTEEEQFRVYKKIVKSMQGMPIIIRTLDIGGDKPLPYVTVQPEDNPFLGERGIRLCLNRPDLIQPQLKAILKASAYGKVRIMFPMVGDLSEWHQIREMINDISKDNKTGDIELGIMIEVPSAALTADALAPHVDFFSIGTNDLTQYTLAIDRMHPTMADRLDGLHPAVLRLIDQTVKSAKKHGKWVGVCGELATDPKAVPILLGLGVTELSINLPAVPAVKAQIRALSLSDAQSLSNKALKCALPLDVRALILE